SVVSCCRRLPRPRTRSAESSPSARKVGLATEAAGAAHVVDHSPSGEVRAASHRSTHGRNTLAGPRSLRQFGGAPRRMMRICGPVTARSGAHVFLAQQADEPAV